MRMDYKTKDALLRGAIFGGLMVAGIGIVIAICSNQTVGSSIGMIIGFATGVLVIDIATTGVTGGSYGDHISARVGTIQ